MGNADTLYDNARMHLTIRTAKKFWSFHRKSRNHSTYIPDLVSGDCPVLGPVRTEQRFKCIDEAHRRVRRNQPVHSQVVRTVLAEFNQFNSPRRTF
ncbi:hypothetical protein TNCT_643881 [Trichonephila clavata]|uniref:Uncharacterized protein n=1 Tax=Trichonephila clavata TaxID=2740835 RepID=A0A8X6INY5_TRICU|nr:hypothetical protein TNCT_643881 [Trichonephila clavata]